MKTLLWIWAALSVFSLLTILPMVKLSSQIDQDEEAGLLPKPDRKLKEQCNEDS